MKDFVSIIIPIYNVEEYIEETLRSALNQTYKNIEYVLVDDCGTDESMEKVYKLLDSDAYKNKVVKVIKHDINKGVSAARNTGVINSSSEYVYFMDSDDIIPHLCRFVSKNAKIKTCAQRTGPDPLSFPWQRSIQIDGSSAHILRSPRTRRLAPASPSAMHPFIAPAIAKPGITHVYRDLSHGYERIVVQSCAFVNPYFHPTGGRFPFLPQAEPEAQEIGLLFSSP